MIDSIMDKIKDYATGKLVNVTPEEKYRQEFEHILIDDLGYPKSHIDIEFIIQRGSNRNAEEADIVIFNTSEKVQENAYPNFDPTFLFFSLLPLFQHS